MGTSISSSLSFWLDRHHIFFRFFGEILAHFYRLAQPPTLTANQNNFETFSQKSKIFVFFFCNRTKMPALAKLAPRLIFWRKCAQNKPKPANQSVRRAGFWCFYWVCVALLDPFDWCFLKFVHFVPACVALWDPFDWRAFKFAFFVPACVVLLSPFGWWIDFPTSLRALCFFHSAARRQGPRLVWPILVLPKPYPKKRNVGIEKKLLGFEKKFFEWEKRARPWFLSLLLNAVERFMVCWIRAL